MAIRPYLAMTAAEIAENRNISCGIAWLDCSFSAAGDGLENLPADLDPGSLLVITDRNPWNGHSTDAVCHALSCLAFRFDCGGILLDFQQPFDPDLLTLCKALLRCLPCPVIVEQRYAADLDCPVFLPPVPLHCSLAEYIAPWKGRTVWLDLSAEGEQITLTERGAAFTALAQSSTQEKVHQENRLHCHYSVSVREDMAIFTLWRTEQDMADLLREAETLGIRNAIGLYQEWQDRRIPGEG